MSLFTQIRKLFSKQQSAQIIGIALQQGSLNCCATSSSSRQNSTTNKAIELPQASFHKIQVESSDFSKAISALQAEYPLVGQCNLVLNAQQTQIVQIDKPSVPSHEIVDALKWQVKDLVSISPDNMVLDYFDDPALVGGKEKVHVVCASVNELKKLVTVINQTGTEVVSITIEEFAFANLLPVQKDACLLVCQQPNEEITLLIVKQGKLYFYRRLRGFSEIANKTEDELMMTIVDSLALEIQRSSDYFERQLKQAPIQQIKVLLPMASESFFARKLAENSHLPVTLLALPDVYQQHREYAAAIGATLLEARLVEKEQLQAQELSHAS
ncbi:MAG: MSHA biogenesis protein MshI [Colwellia sp.]|nr:MSHA biogenesis protein MshI [Colwellia sp.]